MHTKPFASSKRESACMLVFSLCKFHKPHYLVLELHDTQPKGFSSARHNPRVKLFQKILICRIRPFASKSDWYGPVCNVPDGHLVQPTHPRRTINGFRLTRPEPNSRSPPPITINNSMACLLSNVNKTCCYCCQPALSYLRKF